MARRRDTRDFNDLSRGTGLDSPPFATSPSSPARYAQQSPGPQQPPHSDRNENYQLFFSANEGPSGLGLGAQALASFSAQNSPAQSPDPRPCSTHQSPDVSLQYAQNISPIVSSCQPHGGSPQFARTDSQQMQRSSDVLPKSSILQYLQSPRPSYSLMPPAGSALNLRVGSGGQTSSSSVAKKASDPLSNQISSLNVTRRPSEAPSNARSFRRPRETLSASWLTENSLQADPQLYGQRKDSMTGASGFSSHAGGASGVCGLASGTSGTAGSYDQTSGGNGLYAQASGVSITSGLYGYASCARGLNGQASGTNTANRLYAQGSGVGGLCGPAADTSAYHGHANNASGFNGQTRADSGMNGQMSGASVLYGPVSGASELCRHASSTIGVFDQPSGPNGFSGHPTGASEFRDQAAGTSETLFQASGASCFNGYPMANVPSQVSGTAGLFDQPSGNSYFNGYSDSTSEFCAQASGNNGLFDQASGSSGLFAQTDGNNGIFGLTSGNGRLFDEASGIGQFSGYHSGTGELHGQASGASGLLGQASCGLTSPAVTNNMSPVIFSPQELEGHRYAVDPGAVASGFGGQRCEVDGPKADETDKVLVKVVELMTQMDLPKNYDKNNGGPSNTFSQRNPVATPSLANYDNRTQNAFLQPAPRLAYAGNGASPHAVRPLENPFQAPLANTNPFSQDPKRRLSFSENSLPMLNYIPPNALRNVSTLIGNQQSIRTYEATCKNCQNIDRCRPCETCNFSFCRNCWSHVRHLCHRESFPSLRGEYQVQLSQRVSPPTTDRSVAVSPRGMRFQAIGPENAPQPSLLQLTAPHLNTPHLNAPQRHAQSTRVRSGNKTCRFHFKYPARFQEKGSSQLCCAVCFLKHIGRQPQIRSPTLHFRCTFEEDYLMCLRSLDELIDNIPKLVNRSGMRVNPFEWSKMYNHKFFKETIEIPNLNDGHSLTLLLKKTNDFIKEISFKASLFDVRELQAGLSRCIQSCNDLEKLFEGPRPIPIVPNSENPARGSNSLVTGPAVGGRGQKGETTCFFIVLRNSNNERQEWQSNITNVEISDTRNDHLLKTTYDPCKNVKGVTAVIFTFPQQGVYKVKVVVNGELVRGTPFEIRVTDEEVIYNTLFEAQKRLGALEEACKKEKGQLHRPWGISTTRDGAYLATDRSMGVIHIIEDFKILRTIGEPGSRQGQLKCPTKAVELVYDTGVSHIVVADKDNKRLQILTWEGGFVRETSSNCGLKFPWDLCVTEERIIVCTDNNSNFLYCFDTNLTLLTKLDLPGVDTNARGICNGYMNHIIVTEFHRSQINIMYAPSQLYEPRRSTSPLHRVVYKNSHFRPKSKGEKHCERFQGLCMDSAGRILFCDSIQNKVRVISYLGAEIASFPVDGQPQGIAIGHDGDIAVANLTEGVIDLYDVREYM